MKNKDIDIEHKNYSSFSSKSESCFLSLREGTDLILWLSAIENTLQIFFFVRNLNFFALQK